MARIITAFVHEQLARVQKQEISFSRFVELLNEKANEPEADVMKVNDKYYHAFFGWCKIFLPPLDNGKVLIDLEAKSVKYYVIGKGYVTYGRDKNGNNTVLVDKSELFKTEDIKLSDELNLKKMCLNVTIEK